MSLLETFASNLRRLCAGERSIGTVCRATEINQQQFSRYLSGHSLPHPRNRAKIAGYFRIPEAEFFRESSIDPTDGVSDDEAPWSHADLRSSLKLIHSYGRSTLQSGKYFIHFAVPNERNSIMRSTIVVRNDGNITTFRRLTGITERKLSYWSNYRGDHKGVVLERRHGIYLVAINTRGVNNEPTFTLLNWIPSSQMILGGYAMIITEAGPTITAAVMAPCEKGMSLIRALKASHVYSADDPTLDPLIVDSLDQQREALLASMRRLDLTVNKKVSPRRRAQSVLA